MRNVRLAIVLPCYNEESILPFSIKTLVDQLNILIQKKLVTEDSFLCFVDDGSRDNTWNIIVKEKINNPKQIKAIKFSRNFGHQSAILAGMMQFRNIIDCCITMDVDLQDDISVIENMIIDYKNDIEIVYGVRSKRDSDTFFKKWTAQIYYKFLKAMGIELIYNHADFRLVGSKALNAISNFKETNLFLRGLFPALGFKTIVEYYDRKERIAGETKYTLKKMFGLAWNGITSFSNKPLKIATFIGFLVVFISFLLLLWIFYSWLQGNIVPGWASTVIPIYFLGGIQLLFLGILGEYIGKIYLETKERPKYIIETIEGL